MWNEESRECVCVCVRDRARGQRVRGKVNSPGAFVLTVEF